MCAINQLIGFHVFPITVESYNLFQILNPHISLFNSNNGNYVIGKPFYRRRSTSWPIKPYTGRLLCNQYYCLWCFSFCCNVLKYMSIRNVYFYHLFLTRVIWKCYWYTVGKSIKGKLHSRLLVNISHLISPWLLLRIDQIWMHRHIQNLRNIWNVFFFFFQKQLKSSFIIYNLLNVMFTQKASPPF